MDKRTPRCVNERECVLGLLYYVIFYTHRHLPTDTIIVFYFWNESEWDFCKCSFWFRRQDRFFPLIFFYVFKSLYDIWFVKKIGGGVTRPMPVTLTFNWVEKIDISCDLFLLTNRFRFVVWQSYKRGDNSSWLSGRVNKTYFVLSFSFTNLQYLCERWSPSCLQAEVEF